MLNNVRLAQIMSIDAALLQVERADGFVEKRQI
jgi:hypothetical protein